jgi:hypothetical protein
LTGIASNIAGGGYTREAVSIRQFEFVDLLFSIECANWFADAHLFVNRPEGNVI